MTMHIANYTKYPTHAPNQLAGHLVVLEILVEIKFISG
jgi:hypothetical protein